MRYQGADGRNVCRAGLTSRFSSAFSRFGTVVSLLLVVLMIWPVATPSAHATMSGLADVEDMGSIDFLFRVTYQYAASIVAQVVSNKVQIDVVPYREVSIVSMGDRVIMPGDYAVFQYTLFNNGNVVDVFDLQLNTDSMASFEYTWWYNVDGDGRLSSEDLPLFDHTGNGQVDSGPIAPGDHRRLLLVIKVPEQAPFAVHKFSVTATSAVDRNTHGTVENYLEVADSAPFVSVANAPDFVYEGRTYTFPIEYGNTGTSNVHDVTITAELSPYVDYVGASRHGYYDPVSHSVRWTIGTIDPYFSDEIHVEVFAQNGHDYGTHVLHAAHLKYSGTLELMSLKRAQLTTRAPAYIRLFADPAVIRADGKQASRLTALVTDLAGQSVEDDAVITFRTPLGKIQPITESYTSCSVEEAWGQECLQVYASGGMAQVDLYSPNIESDEYTVVPVTVSAMNPDTGEVRERISMYFSPGGIVGRLFNSETGHPESGVEVRLIRLDTNGEPFGNPVIRYTDENGYYIFPVPEGNYRVIVVRQTPDGPREFVLPSLAVEEAFGSVVFAPVTIIGQLINQSTGLGVGDATVELFDESDRMLATTFTDEYGNYTLIVTEGFEDFSVETLDVHVLSTHASTTSIFDSMKPPTWRVQARTPDGRGAEAVVYDIRPGDMVLNLNLAVHPLGIVLDKETGEPIEGAIVSLLWAGPPIEDQLVFIPLQNGVTQRNPLLTDAMGTYMFRVTPGYYKLQAIADGYRSLVTSPMIVQGRQVALPLELEPLGSDRISLTKEALSPFSRPNERIGYMLHVENVTGQTLAEVKVVDQLPVGLEYVVGTANRNASYDPVEHTLTWTLQNVGAGQQVALHYEVTVDPGASGDTLTNIARAQVVGDASFETASAETVVGHWPDLVIEKSADQSSAMIGDVILYQVTVENRSQALDAFDLIIEDTLPEGFRYVSGSSGLNGAAFFDPTQSDGRLRWSVGNLSAESDLTLTYAAVVTLDAVGSDGLNVAYVDALTEDSQAFRVGPGSARVRVEDGLFGHRGRIVGRVFVDENRDGLPSVDEPGVAGVEIVLDDGRMAVSSSEGFYLIDDVEPGIRSVKLADVSLPYGLTLQTDALTDRFGGESLFAHVRPGATAMVDFAVWPGEKDLEDLRADEVRPRHEDVLHRALEKIHGEDDRTFAEMVEGELRSEWSLPRVVTPDPYEMTYRRLMTVTIEGHLNEPLQLLVNGEAVDSSQIGRMVEDGRNNLLTLTYYGVQLDEGLNVLTAEAGDQSHEITVAAVGRPADVQVVWVPKSTPFRNEMPVPVTLLVTDTLGLPVEDGTTLTLHAQGAQIRTRDVNPTQPGIQLQTKDGFLEVLFAVPGRNRRDILLQVETSDGKWELPIDTEFLPEPRLLAGAVDVKFGLEDGSINTTGSAYYREEFQGGWRIGARYDGRIDRTGDSTGVDSVTPELGWDDETGEDLAPAMDRYFVKVERRGSHLLYGDFSPSNLSGNQYTKRAGRATGLETVLENEWGRLTGYSFDFRWGVKTDEIPARGISGEYYLSHGDVVVGTEEVWLAAYDSNDDDRNEPASRILLERGKDYQIDYRKGALLFKEPIPTYNRLFQRQYIEVTYSVRTVKGDGGAWGVAYTLPDVGLGRHTVTYVAERGPHAERPTTGIDGQLDLAGMHATVGYEFATQAASHTREKGQAASVQFNLRPSSVFNMSLRAQHVEGEFLTPGDEKPLAPGLTVQSQVGVGLGDRMELIYDRTQSAKKQGDKQYTDQIKLPFEVTPAVRGSFVLRSKGSQPEPWGDDRQLSFGMSGEVQTSENGSLGLSQEYQAGEDGVHSNPMTLTYRHRLTQSLTASMQFEGFGDGGSRKNPWLFSLESTPEHGPRLYGRYRATGDDDDRGNTTVLGVENRWELTPGLYAGIAAERTSDSMTGDQETATSWRLEYVFSQTLRVHVQQERRDDATGHTAVDRLGFDGRTDAGFSYELNSSWRRGGEQSADGRSVSWELEGNFAYRDLKASKGFAAGQLIRSHYTHGGGAGFPQKNSEMTLVAVEGGYRITPRLTAVGKVVAKHTVTDWEGNMGDSVWVELGLQQIGVQVDLNDRYNLDVYGRRVHDNFGSESVGYAWELVRMLTGAVGIGLGYSSVGADDPDLRLVADWREGWYIRMRFKF